jgi:hypothetical protein
LRGRRRFGLPFESQILSQPSVQLRFIHFEPVFPSQSRRRLKLLDLRLRTLRGFGRGLYLRGWGSAEHQEEDCDPSSHADPAEYAEETAEEPDGALGRSRFRRNRMPGRTGRCMVTGKYDAAAKALGSAVLFKSAFGAVHRQTSSMDQVLHRPFSPHPLLFGGRRTDLNCGFCDAVGLDIMPPGLARGMMMDYRNRKTIVRNETIAAFIRKLSAGEFLIPTFQRWFIWDPEHIVDLWDSIYRRYPVGSILYWKTHARLYVHRQVGGFYVPDDAGDGRKTRCYILDGQQRATSLLASFHGGTGKVRERHSFDYTIYFDLTRADFFFEKDYYKHRWDAESAFLIRLKEVPDLPADYAGQLAALSGYSDTVRENLEQLRCIFTDYRMLLIGLVGYDMEGVCGIYERINQTGVRLTNMDILTARGFKNYATVVEEDFPVS